ncbi:hypothetical protein HZC32_00540 [Candidatus Woesearchaeota archaeon]|nr:hypothetical protein [Candidatus Woesearchaeota archaeon]
MFKPYLTSFKVKKVFWQTFLVELITILLIVAAFYGLGSYFSAKVASLTGDKSVAELQELIVNSPEQALPLVGGLQSTIILCLIILIVLVIGSWMLYSFAQALIWNLLQNKKLTSKTYWKWNWLHLALIFPLLLVGIIGLILIFIFTWLVNSLLGISPSFYFEHLTLMQNLSSLFRGMFSFFLVLILISGVFLVYYSFVREYKVWLSIGEAFHLLKLKWKKLWKVWLLILLAAIIVTGILLLFKLFITHPTSTTIFDLVVSLMFLSWMRIYLLEQFKE